ncbi:MAG: RNA polymerase sigma-70 factor ECF subfamily [Gammaproteobacteria bacterium]|nr:MAG: RNA polymerase sigma-70 factor ECF subfamily [Gammaproteobacteria bacterium]TND07126.1 MAG: RNA polymerase sigma-70 factor, ECF subfamily [Gammaproteobacteria bacterium]
MQPTKDAAGDETLKTLISRVALGDQAALAALYDITAGRVYALALRIVANPACAEEIASDTYYQIWTQAGRYDATRGRVLAWIMTICRSRALDKLRQRDPAEQRSGPVLISQDIEAPEQEPLDLLLVTERCNAIHDALEALDAHDRLLLSLAFFKEMSHQEIARQTDIPLGTVKSTIRRSMLSLRSALNLAELGAKEVS